MLSRKEMEDIIVNQKLSVFIEGHGIIDNVANLPSEASLAKGDKEAEKAARASLKAQAEAIKAELASLDDEPEEEKEEVKDNGEIDTAEADVQRAEVERRAAVALKTEEARKDEEAKKVASVKKAEEAKK